MNKVRVVVALLFVTALVLGLGAISVFAQGPDNTTTATAAYIDNQPHTIPGNSYLWYRFLYGGGNTLITVTVVNGANTGIRFDVYTPEQVANLTGQNPIGRGSTPNVPCGSTPPGECAANNLLWTGKFHTGGYIYVQLFNDNVNPATFTLTVAGDDVTQCLQPGQTAPSGSVAIPCSPNQPTQQTQPGQSPATPVPTIASTSTITSTGTVTPTEVISPTTPSAAPSPAPAANVGCPLFGQVPTASTNPGAPGCGKLDNTLYTDPYHGLFLNNTSQTVPGNSSMWFRFGYGGGGSQIALVMADGTNNGLNFKVFTPDQVAGNWWITPPIGQGTPRNACAQTQVNQIPPCNLNDLYWTGGFQPGGIYYVQVNDPMPNAVQFLLTITGSDVALCPASSQAQSNPALVDMAALCNTFAIKP